MLQTAPILVLLAAHLHLLHRSTAMPFGRTWDDWIASYAQSHQNPFNRVCHTVGIPLIALSVPLFVVALFVHRLWPVPTTMFVAGWLFQFAGHAVEGKPPEFLKDWRYLFVGVRWWMAKMAGRA